MSGQKRHKLLRLLAAKSTTERMGKIVAIADLSVSASVLSLLTETSGAASLMTGRT
jgi:hypothetical protein